MAGTNSAASPKASEPRRRPSVARRLASALLIGVALLATAWFGRAHVLAPPISWLASQQVAERFGAALSIGAIEGDWLGHLRLRDVRLEPNTGNVPVVRRLVAPIIEVRGSLLALAGGRTEALSSIGLHIERLELDLTEPTADEAPSAPFELPPLPGIELTVDELVVLLPGDRRLVLNGVALDYSLLEEHALALVATALYDDPAIGRRTGELNLSGDWRDGRLKIASLQLEQERFGALTVSDGALDLSELGAGRLSAHAPLAFDGATLIVDWTLAGGDAAIRAVGQGLELERLRAFAGLIPDMPLSGVVDEVDAVVTLPADAAPTVTGFVRAHDLRWDEQFVDQLSTRVAYSGSALRLDETRIERSGDRLIGAGITLPLQAQGLAGWLAAVRGRMSLDVADARRYWPNERIAERADEPVRARFQTAWTAAGVVIESGELTTREGIAELEEGRIQWAAELERSELDLALRVDLPDLAELGIDAVTGGCRGVVRLAGPIDALMGHADLEARVDWAELESASLVVACDFDGERATIERLMVDGERIDLSIAGAIAFDGTLAALKVEGEVRELDHFVAGVPAGRVLVEAQLAGDLGAPTGPFLLRGSELDGLGGIGQELDEVLVEGRLFADSVELESLRVTSRHGALEASADARWDRTARTVDVLLASLVARNAGSELALEAPARLAFGPDTADVGPLVLSGAGGRAELTYVRNSERHEGECSLSEFDLFALLGPLVPEGFRVDGIDGAVRARFEPRPVFSAELAVRGLRPPGDASQGWMLDLDAGFDGAALQVQAAQALHPRWGRFDLVGSGPLDLSGATPWREGPVALSLDVHEFDVGAAGRLWDGSRLAGVWTGRAELAGTWRELVGQVAIATTEARLIDGGDPELVLFGPGAIDVRLDVQPARVVAEARIEGFEDVTFEGEGSIATGIDVARLVAAPPEILAAEIEGQVDFELQSLTRIGRWIDALPSCDGRVAARGSIAGRLGAPRFAGQVRLADGRVRAAAELPPLEALNGHLTFSEERVVLNGLVGELGAAPFALNGSIELPETGPVCKLALSGENLLLMRRRGFKLRADTDLAVDGSLDDLLVHGHIALTDGRFTKSFDPFSLLDPGARGGSLRARSGLEFSIASDPLFGATRFDVKVTAREAFAIKNNVLRGGVRPDLQLAGRAEVPYFVGPIYIDPTRIVLPAGRLEIRTGTVTFQRSDPFRPELELSGEAFVRGYRIDVRVDGSLEDPEITLSSTPPLPSEDALVLIVTGQLPTNVASTEAVQTVALFLAQDFVQRWFASESTEDDESFLDRIEVWSGVDPIKTGVETYHVSLRLAGDPTQRGLVHSIRGEQDAYEHFNFGYRFLFRLR